MVADFDEVLSFVKEKHREAKDGSETIIFPVEKYAKMYEGMRSRSFGGEIIASAPSISDLPQYKVLKHSTGQSAWAAILAVDMRKSSRIATEHGAEATYVLMHTYLPTMAYLVEKAGGKVVGLRGDGLFAAFGVTELVNTGTEVTPEAATEAVRGAVRCGKAMIEAMEDAVSPVMRNGGLIADLKIGVGIDVGNVVITRIGLESASEVTAYGAPVNHACKKFASKASNQIRVSQVARDMYPKTKGGRVTFANYDGGFFVNFPSDVIMLEGDRAKNRRTAK